MLTFAIGDVHGCFSRLIELLANCRSYAASRQYRLVFLGDYIDRGPDSRSVVESLIQLQSQQQNVVYLLGNHEELCIRSIDDPVANAQWLNNGGIETLDSYSQTGGMQLLEQHVRWLEQLPLQFDDGMRLFVHAGVDVSKPLGEQSKRELLWMREPFLSFRGKLDRVIVHGHTPVKNGPEVHPNRVNLDTGAVYGGPLTAGIFVDSGALPIGFLTA
jgi:serine/threonine protein phosphatase 1